MTSSRSSLGPCFSSGESASAARPKRAAAAREGDRPASRIAFTAGKLVPHRQATSSISNRPSTSSSLVESLGDGTEPASSSVCGDCGFSSEFIERSGSIRRMLVSGPAFKTMAGMASGDHRVGAVWDESSTGRPMPTARPSDTTWNAAATIARLSRMIFARVIWEWSRILESSRRVSHGMARGTWNQFFLRGAEHCEGGRGKGGERVPSALSA
eukprot:scaffold7832_cov106-Isochrysis_galbana.AAC.4